VLFRSRAGRDGAAAETMMLFSTGDIRMRRQFIEDEDSDDIRKQREHKRFDALLAYCEAVTCRRQTLLSYFGEQSPPCGNCDICLNPVELEDGTEEALLVTGVIIETGERFGQAHIIDVLRGADTEKVRKFSHDRLEVHGSGTKFAKNQWMPFIRQMIASGILEIDVAGYGALHLTEKAGNLGRGKAEFLFRPQDEQAAPEKTSGKRARKPLTTPVLISENDNALLISLKHKRLELAKVRNVPAYVIFPDRTLMEMAQQKPSSLEDMANIRGVGEKKLARLGQIFLDVILDH